MHRNAAARRVAGLTVALLVAGALTWMLHPGVPSSGQADAAAGPSITIDDVFAADGVLVDILTRDYANFDVTGPGANVAAKFTYIDHGIRGPIFFGYCNPDLSDPCECHCTEGVDPCTTPGQPPISYRARLTVELWIPNNINFAGTPVLYVDKVEARTGQGYQEKALLAKTLAKKGIPAALWSEIDHYPVGGGSPAVSVHEYFGYPGPATFQRAALRWLRTRDPLNLTPEDLRFDDRYLTSQGYLLTTTFFQRKVVEFFGGDPDAQAWVDRVESVYAGGSKTGGGAISAAGIDPRCVGTRISNFMSMDASDDCAPSRYDRDWRECPVNCPTDDPCTDVPSGEHRWVRHSTWAWGNRDNHPSYMDVYRPDNNRARYEQLFYVEIGGTHDWINPLGSHTRFWDSVDGMTGGLVDPLEDQWDYRLVRRMNRDHGVSTIVGQTSGGLDVRADQLMVWGTLRHLAKNKAMPRIDTSMVDVSGNPATEPWSVRIRVSETRAGHDPALHEQFKIWVALSDDRDFRRCTPPILCMNIDSQPCEANGVCRDPSWDDNKPQEDYFVEIAPSSVTVDGEFRDILFAPPAEALAISNPIAAVIVEGFFEGGIVGKIQDDWILWTDVHFENEEMYPPYACCPP